MRSALMCAWMRTGSEKEAKKACFERKALNSYTVYLLNMLTGCHDYCIIKENLHSNTS